MANMILLAFLTISATICAAGWVPSAEFCLPDAELKELSGCIAMTNNRDECEGKTSESERLDCYCTQEYLSSLYHCESDVQLCLQNHMFDNVFEAEINTWHTTCDKRITSTTLTTPPLPTITQPYDMGVCDRLYHSCLRGDYETNRCSDQFLPTSSLSYVSCVCQKNVYSLFSECQYNGNISCKRTTAAESNILGYSICSYFWPGSKTLSSVDLTSLLGITGSDSVEATKLAPVESWKATAVVSPTAAPLFSANAQGDEIMIMLEKELKRRALRF